MAAKKIALFIDADNISAKFGKQIIETLESRGELFLRRIYGNWEKNSLHGWNECILNFSLRAVQQPDFVTGKNATDMSLTIDAMDVLHEGKAEIFALVSNDSDFTPLVIRLREGGMKTIGLGTANASNAFRAACNEFIELDTPLKVSVPTVKIQEIEKKISRAPEKNSSVQMSLFGEENLAAPKSEPSPKKSSSSKVVPITRREDFIDPKKLRTLHGLLQEVARLHGDDDGFTAMCWAGNYIRQKQLNFSVKDFGYGSLHRFVSDFPDLYEVIQRDNGENFCYRCRTLKPRKPTVDDKLPKMHDALREVVKAQSDAEGFANLCYVGSQLNQMKLGFGVKTFGYSTLQKFLDAFPDRYELRKEGHKIFMRCRGDLNVADALARDEKLHELLRRTASAHSDADGFTNLNHLDEAHDKNFLQKFIADNADRYELRTTSSGVFYRCREEKLHELLRRTASAHSDATGFTNLNHLDEAHDKNFLQKFIGDNPERYELRTNPNGVFYRCRDEKLHELLRRTASAHSDADGFTNLNHVDDSLDKNFLQKFITDNADRYELRTNPSGVFYRCRDEKLHALLRLTASAHSDATGFTNLNHVDDSLDKNFLQKFIADNAERYELRTNPSGVFYRCRDEKLHDLLRRTASARSDATGFTNLNHVDDSLDCRCRDDDKLDKLHDLLRQTAKARSNAAGFTDLSCVGNSLGKQKIGFGIRDLGYGTLQKFVADFPDRYELRKEGHKVFYRCRDDKLSDSTDDDKLRRLHDILRESATLHADADGFSPINHAGQEIKSKHLGFGIRNFGYGQLREFVSDFPDLYEIAHDEDGKKFRYRCKRA